MPVPVKVLQVLGQILAADAEGDVGGRKMPGLDVLEDEGGWEDESEDESEGDAGAAGGLAEVQLMGKGLKG